MSAVAEAAASAARGRSPAKKEDKFADVYIPENPQSVADFGYEFDAEGRLSKLDGSGGFEWQGQKHYNALGDMVTTHIQTELVNTYGYQEVWLPLDATPEEPKCNIFVSADLESNGDKVLLLIQGTGAVRAGQWARSLCINESLALGSILPFVERAAADGYAVVVFNPNLNRGPKPDRTPIRGNARAEDHALYVYDNFVRNAPAAVIDIIAHSYGGISTATILEERGDEIVPGRLRRIALTDTLYAFAHRDVSPAVLEHIRANTVNWLASDLSLGTPKTVNRGPPADCALVSAGHPKHEYTTGCAFTSIFEFLNTGVVPDPVSVDDDEAGGSGSGSGGGSGNGNGNGAEGEGGDEGGAEGGGGDEGGGAEGEAEGVYDQDTEEDSEERDDDGQ